MPVPFKGSMWKNASAIDVMQNRRMHNTDHHTPVKVLALFCIISLWLWCRTCIYLSNKVKRGFTPVWRSLLALPLPSVRVINNKLCVTIYNISSRHCMVAWLYIKNFFRFRVALVSIKCGVGGVVVRSFIGCNFAWPIAWWKVLNNW